jgi:RNA polymerase sigma factor (TIGR02999 family)
VQDDRSDGVTRLLQDVAYGRPGAAEALLPLVYSELRRLARARVRSERSTAAHQPTSLVHEAYLRLVRDAEYRFESRAHFFAAAAEAMRRIAIERARARARLKRSGELRRVTLDEGAAVEEPRADELFALDEALSRLEALDPSMSGVVKLRFFAGLTVEETAQALDLSPRTVKRQWAAARAWLHDALGERG